ncbi:fungal-specific transcription factor domain-containing protein [Aspergillus heterothallicus]
MSILDSFSELRECIEQPTRSPAPRPHLLQTKHDVNPVPHLLSVQNITTTRAEILQAMPDRSVVDRHVFAYFNRLSPVFTHRPSFLRQYESFWKNPSAAPVMWVSILYSIMCLMPLEHATSPSSAGDTLSDQSRYLAQVVQCLILGDYSRGGPFTIEALLHYFMVEHSRRRDADTSNWALSGLIIRLALHKGYHREPSLFPNITPYDGELRRRVWMVLYFIDAVISIQMGLPRLIKDEQCDTGFPHNLLDTDFDEDTAALPTPRSDAEITPIQWWVAKYKLLIMIARIADMSLLNIGDGDASSDAKVKQADTLLRATYDQIQPSMKFTSLVNCLGASPETIVGRLSVSLLFLKGLIILHRGYVVGSEPAETRSSFILHNDSAAAPDSARICIEAALQMLEYQDLIYYESQEGGAIASLSWRLRSSSIAHEFFTATSVLCSYMYRVYIRDPGIPQLPQEQIQAIERALVRTHGTWQSQRAVLKDAQTMTEILGLLLAKLQERADGCGTTPRVMDNILDIPLGSGSEDLGALLQDNFGLYGEGMNDFSSFIGW